MAKRYSQDLKDRAAWMVNDRLADDQSCTQWKAINEIAPKLGIATRVAAALV